MVKVLDRGEDSESILQDAKESCRKAAAVLLTLTAVGAELSVTRVPAASYRTAALLEFSRL